VPCPDRDPSLPSGDRLEKTLLPLLDLEVGVIPDEEILDKGDRPIAVDLDQRRPDALYRRYRLSRLG
jgi:hypothetical protein